jgi:hypothetical protein
MVDHERAVAELLAAIGEVPAARWAEPPATDRWSAAEVVRHLELTYLHLGREQRGEVTSRVLPRPWRAWLLRRLILPRLLAGAPLPRGVRAPREVRPDGATSSPAAATAALVQAVREWAGAMATQASDQGARATHPFFGKLPLLTMLRFTTLHTRHHCRQLQRAGAGLPLHDA